MSHDYDSSNRISSKSPHDPQPVIQQKNQIDGKKTEDVKTNAVYRSNIKKDPSFLSNASKSFKAKFERVTKGFSNAGTKIHHALKRTTNPISKFASPAEAKKFTFDELAKNKARLLLLTKNTSEGADLKEIKSTIATLKKEIHSLEKQISKENTDCADELLGISDEYALAINRHNESMEELERISTELFVFKNEHPGWWEHYTGPESIDPVEGSNAATRYRSANLTGGELVNRVEHYGHEIDESVAQISAFEHRINELINKKR